MREAVRAKERVTPELNRAGRRGGATHLSHCHRQPRGAGGGGQQEEVHSCQRARAESSQWRDLTSMTHDAEPATLTRFLAEFTSLGSAEAIRQSDLGAARGVVRRKVR